MAIQQNRRKPVTVLWRWREYLKPKTFWGLYHGSSKEEAEKNAIASGEYSASRVYEVSIDDGATWYSAPPDMPVIDINGNSMPEKNRRTGKPSDAAKTAIQKKLEEAEVKAKPFDYGR